DLIYNPAETVFLKKGLEQGATCINGQKMLEIQAEASWKIWTK
ncbi:MAG: shikimate dehydrogenase, partial [Thermodesulfobacteriota bacterium]|nr:shikimate dehydrogenase [Thermodesulfobacteriota bacterium]